MAHPRTLLVAAGLAAMLAAFVRGASAAEQGSQGLELSQNRKMIGLPTQSRDLLQASYGYPATGYQQAGHQQAGYQQAGYQQAGHQQAGHQQAGYQPAGYQQAGYNQPNYQQATGTTGWYPRPRPRYPATPAGYSPPQHSTGLPQAGTQVGNRPTMMGRLFERITGVPAANRPPLGDRLVNLMSGVGSVVRTVGDVLEIVNKFKD